MDKREDQFLHSCLARCKPQGLTLRAFWPRGLATSNEDAKLASNRAMSTSLL